MSQSKPTFSHRVYWKSQEEHDLVVLRAASLGLRGNISAYIRDCVKADMQASGWRTQQFGVQPQQQTQQPIPQQFPSTVKFEGKVIPTDDLPPDLDLSEKEDDLGSLAERMGLFDIEDDETNDEE